MKVENKPLELNPNTNLLVYALMGLGVVTFAGGIFLNPQRVWYAYLLNHALFLGLAVGSTFFLVVHYLAAAGWNVAMRRISESFAMYIFYAVVFNIILFFGISKIYPWSNHEFMAADHLLHAKMGYFSLGFYSARALVFYAVMMIFAYKMVSNSVAQDQEGGVDRLHNQKPLASLFLVTFAPLFTVFSVDLIKSLDPKWFSTMYGVYVFVGFVQASVAASIIVIRMLQKHGYLKFITADHFHDLGKYLFGFSIFWAYIGVSQYLLIWYANLPEETTFYMARQVPGWVGISILLPILRFALPFLLLLPRMAKRTPGYLQFVACIVLVGAWVDLNWLIMPTLNPKGFSISFLDLGMLLGFLGFFSFCVRNFLSKHATVPVKDPYLHETLHHHVY